MSEPKLYETHCHTPLCKHAIGEPSEYAAVAKDQGLKGLTVTCHNPMPDGFSSRVRMDEDQLFEYIELVDSAREEWTGDVDVLLGLEADYFEGYEGWLATQLQQADFHYVLGSVHPQLGEFRQKYWVEDPLEVQRTYFGLLAKAAETGLFDCLAHPDLIKNETSRDWDPHRILPDVCRALDRIAATGIAMELNTSGRNKKIPQMNPCPEMLVEMRARDIPVVIGADAHKPGRVGDYFVEALDLLESCGYSEVSYFRERARVNVAIEAARESLCVAQDID